MAHCLQNCAPERGPLRSAVHIRESNHLFLRTPEAFRDRGRVRTPVRKPVGVDKARRPPLRIWYHHSLRMCHAVADLTLAAFHVLVHALDDVHVVGSHFKQISVLDHIPMRIIDASPAGIHVTQLVPVQDYYPYRESLPFPSRVFTPIRRRFPEHVPYLAHVFSGKNHRVPVRCQHLDRRHGHMQLPLHVHVFVPRQVCHATVESDCVQEGGNIRGHEQAHDLVRYVH